jgi:putative glutamine amidotransferase
MAIRIGITTSFEDDEQSLRRDYVRAVERAGGVPLLLPTTDTAAVVDVLTGDIDGLIVPGGPAIVDNMEGTLPNDLDAPDPARSRSDRRYVDAAWAAGKPILGICYGMQLVNARQGGTIVADAGARREGALVHSHKRGGSEHPIRIAETSWLGRTLNRDRVSVNTRHVQALATPGDGFSVAATAPDGVIEAIEHESGKVFGVQFHPERMGESMHPLFQDFVDRARASRSPAPSPAPSTAPDAPDAPDAANPSEASPPASA